MLISTSLRFLVRPGDERSYSVVTRSNILVTRLSSDFLTEEKLGPNIFHATLQSQNKI